jgi:hypothetical protein
MALKRKIAFIDLKKVLVITALVSLDLRKNLRERGRNHRYRKISHSHL